MTTGSGQDAQSYVDSVALTFPVVIDGTHNQFAFNSVQYIVPSGSYTTAKQVAAAVNKATTGLSAVLSVTASSAVPGGIRFTSKAQGAQTQAFAAGSSNDCLGRLGITAAWTIGRTQTGAAASTAGAQSQQATLYSSDVYWDGTRYSGNPARVGEDNV